jgi:FkbM family methyltransferase
MFRKNSRLRTALRYVRVNEALFSEPVRHPDGFLFRGRRDMQDGIYEKVQVGWIKRCLSDADLFIDVGANQGYFTCVARNQEKPVIAIEPITDNLRYLYANLDVNQWRDVEVLPLALSDHAGLLEFHGDGTGASVFQGWFGYAGDLSYMVPANTLDGLLTPRLRGRRILLKVDAEGSEYPLLQGGTELLAAVPRPVWLVEVCLTEAFPDGLNPHFVEIFDLFFRQGYAAYAATESPFEILRKDVARWNANRERDKGATETILFADPEEGQRLLAG